jgi:lipid-binding SYLF domain-containing protein
MYGANVGRHEILDGTVRMPASAKNLMYQLHTYTGRASGM